MAVIADRCPEIQVTVVDINQARIEAWNDADLSQLPVYEPGLDAVVSRARGRNLSFSTAVEATIAAADMVFISVNTPTKTKGLGAGQASDLRWVEACARTVAQAATGHTIVVEKSTLPVRTAAAIKTILEAAKADDQQRSFCALQSRVSGGGHGDPGSGGAGPGADRRRGCCFDRCLGIGLRPLGAGGPDPAHQPLEQRALQAHCQCLSGAADQFDQFNRGVLRGQRGGRARGGAGDWNR